LDGLTRAVSRGENGQHTVYAMLPASQSCTTAIRIAEPLVVREST